MNGRIEFNPSRVKTHFIHTIMRLELEKRQEMPEDSTASVIQNHPKWWSQMRMQPAQSQPSCSYSNYSYAQSTPQYPAKIPPISTMVSTGVVGQESLDLHYAYRDEYNSTSLSLNSESASSFSNGNNTDYYSNYNYLGVPATPSASPYQNGYQMHHLAPQQTASTHVPYQSQLPQSSFPSDCQYTNYTPTNGSNRFNSRIEPAASVDSFATNYPTSGGASNSGPSLHPRINYPGMPPVESFCAIASGGDDAGAQGQVLSVGDPNENLSEIIKKSIVETVTA